MSNYIDRAAKAARFLARLFADCLALEDFITVIDEYNSTHSRPLRYAYGVSRIVIVRTDYVIKFDITPDEAWDDGWGGNRAGDNSTEEEIYNRAVEDGYAYLLAKPTVMSIGSRTVTIMPRVHGVDDWSRYWGDFCTEDEYRWLVKNVCDLHDGNLGYYKHKVCVIDYAWSE